MSARSAKGRLTWKQLCQKVDLCTAVSVAERGDRMYYPQWYQDEIRLYSAAGGCPVVLFPKDGAKKYPYDGCEVEIIDEVGRLCTVRFMRPMDLGA